MCQITYSLLTVRKITTLFLSSTKLHQRRLFLSYFEVNISDPHNGLVSSQPLVLRYVVRQRRRWLGSILRAVKGELDLDLVQEQSVLFWFGGEAADFDLGNVSDVSEQVSLDRLHLLLVHQRERGVHDLSHCNGHTFLTGIEIPWAQIGLFKRLFETSSRVGLFHSGVIHYFLVPFVAREIFENWIVWSRLGRVFPNQITREVLVLIHIHVWIGYIHAHRRNLGDLCIGRHWQLGDFCTGCHWKPGGKGKR